MRWLMFKNTGFLVGLMAPILLAACTQATPAPLPDLDVFNLTLRAEPVEGEVLTMRFIAEIAGGPDNARELNCIEGGWYFGEGFNWSVFPECIPWKPDWKFPRHFEQTHTYSQPGTYHVNFTHGPLEASLVVVVP